MLRLRNSIGMKRIFRLLSIFPCAVLLKIQIAEKYGFLCKLRMSIISNHAMEEITLGISFDTQTCRAWWHEVFAFDYLTVSKNTGIFWFKTSLMAFCISLAISDWSLILCDVVAASMQTTLPSSKPTFWFFTSRHLKLIFKKSGVLKMSNSRCFVT